MIPLVQRLRLQAEDLHLLAPASETVKCLSLAADTLEKQSAALKLAREALGEVQDLLSESHGVYGLHLNGDESPWSELEQGGRFERLTTLPEALAAINEVIGE